MQTHWASNDVRYSKMCYSDIPYLYVPRGMAEQSWPYADTGGRYEVMEYPVGISLLRLGDVPAHEAVRVGAVRAGPRRDTGRRLLGLPGMITERNTYFLVNAVLLLAFGLLATFFMAGAHRRRPWDAIGFVASPVLLLSGLVNWDMLAVACVAGAFWAWARGRPVLTGIFIGLGTATKLYPLFLLGAMLVVCVRRGQVSVFVKALAAGAAAWAVLNLPVMLTGFDQWKVFWTFNAARGPDLGSLWLMASNRHRTAAPDTVNLVSWLVFGAACIAVLVLGLLAAHAAADRAAGVPGRGGVPDRQQGLLAAVRALAAAAGRAGPATLA